MKSKSFFLLVATLVASVFLIGCTPVLSGSSNAVRASIVGTWQASSISYRFFDKDGKAVSSKEVVTAIYKDQGYPINNDEIEAAAAMLDNMPVESARFEYSGDGTLKSGTKSNGTRGSFVEVGKYRLEGNKLIIVVEGITAVQTINSLDQNELIIESTKDSILAIYGNDVYSEALAMYERIGYNWRSITVYLRVS